MANPNFESSMSQGDDEATFRKSLDAMTPQAATVSISQTFYQAGYAAALAQSQRSTTQPRSSWRVASTLAAGILIGIAGYAVGVSKPIETELAERAQVTMPRREVITSVQERQPERSTSSADTEVSEVAMASGKAQEWNASLPFLAYLLPSQKQTLSMGSLLGPESQNDVSTLAHASANSFSVSLTSHPSNSQDVLNAILAP